MRTGNGLSCEKTDPVLERSTPMGLLRVALPTQDVRVLLFELWRVQG